MKNAQGKVFVKPKASNTNSGSGSIGGVSNNKVKGVIKDTYGKMSWDLDNFSAVKRGGMYHGYSRNAAEKIAASVVNEGGGKTRG